MPSFGLAHPRARFRFDRLTAAALARLARAPSYRAPRAADLHDPATFQPPAEPAGAAVMSGRAFLTTGTTSDAIRLVAVQPFVRELAASTHLTGLRRLDLTGNHVGPAGAAALAASPHLGGLRELGLSGNALGDEGATVLARSSWLAGLERLEIAENGLSAEALARIMGAAPRLTAVDVSGNAAVIPALLRRGMREVVAARTTGRDDLPFVGSPDLHSLDLRHTRGPLCDLGPFPALIRLDLGFTDGGNGLDPAAFQTVSRLGLRGCRLTEPELPATLETLDLSVNPLDEPAAAVAGCQRLVHLDLANTGLTDAALGRLLAALPRLRSLNVAWNPVADPAAFLAHPALEALDLTGTRFGRLAVRALAARFGTIPA